jgi:hypothetical protein
VPAELAVHVNRDGLHSLDVPASFETGGSFDVRLVNHGEAVHVHLHLDDALAAQGVIDANNHYVKGDSERLVRVDVAEDARGLGKLKVATSYGTETRYVDVDLVEPEDSDGSVQVDESLSKPRPSPEPEGGLVEDSRLPVVALGGFAILVAIGAVLVVEETAIAVAALGVIAAVAVAVYAAVLAE